MFFCLCHSYFYAVLNFYGWENFLLLNQQNISLWKENFRFCFGTKQYPNGSMFAKSCREHLAAGIFGAAVNKVNKVGRGKDCEPFYCCSASLCNIVNPILLSITLITSSSSHWGCSQCRWLSLRFWIKSDTGQHSQFFAMFWEIFLSEPSKHDYEQT